MPVEPKYEALIGKVEDLAAKVQALVNEAMEAGMREGVAWSAGFLDTLAQHPDTPDVIKPLYQNARDALRLQLLDLPNPTPENTDG